MGGFFSQRPLNSYNCCSTRILDRRRYWRSSPIVPADRVEHPVSVVYTADDGHPSIRVATCMEVAEVVAAVRDEALEALRQRAEKAEQREETPEHVAASNKCHVQVMAAELAQAEARIARVHALAHTYEVNARTIDGVARRNFFELFAEEL
ncbi:hypothetical protein ACFWYW_04020 [Nonomuraea sp. NPDC059023]|uniref:hypothetical protein n=1 Tax=unclassified Nonomuraea TaxID=2593643 RepID=UPI0036AFB22F